jgi:signal transduction histidine kinase
LDEVGFPCAAEWYIEGFSKRSGINVKADIANSHERLPKRVEIALFRVITRRLDQRASPLRRYGCKY